MLPRSSLCDNELMSCQKGFSSITLILGALFIVVLGVGYYIYSQKPQTPIYNVFPAQTTPVPDQAWKIYTNEYFSFTYPSDWRVKETASMHQVSLSLSGLEGTISVTWGSGLGGGCNPEDHIKLKVFGEDQDICRQILDDGVESWWLIYKKLDDMNTLEASVRINPSNQPNKEVIIKILESFKFANQSESDPNLGAITGTLCYPSEVIPSGKIMAKNISTNQIFAQDFQGNSSGSTRYSFKLQPGTYYIAYEPSNDINNKGYYTIYSTCMDSENSNECNDKKRLSLPVEVRPRVITPNIDLCDYNSDNSPEF